ncbi:gas vesicle accessory protein GvpU [Methylomonas koyamae]|uniref:gas vesicle accessory protein GvpU n=1 Tax=Methylomonas koyamae TaxID=702114 RepID=UPI000AAA5E2B|nr:gas vesicle accessory protein GvpU [Methylomonas koyamae]BBL58512.1 hypothetical protein MKFW12EY_21250 [Methylomonas koyamae]
MTEQNAVPPRVEDQTQPVTVVAKTDWFLQNLVGFANLWGIEVGITLQVSGMLVSGTLISGDKYFEEFAAQFSGGFKNSPELSEPFHKLISSYKKVYDVAPEEESDCPPSNFVHLRNAQFYHPGQNPLPTSQGVLWRGRVAEVGGFILGSFSNG